MIERWTRGLVIALAALACSACGAKDSGPEPEQPLETVDLAEETAFAPDDDPRAEARRGQLAGILPDDFPRDLPLYLPASVDGFGAASGWRTVDLTTSASPAEVRDALARALRARGWRGDVALGASTLEKDGRSVHLSLSAGTFGSRYSYRY